MEIPIPKALKKLWELWELRSVLVLSLSLQVVLILVSPLRKRTKNDMVFLLLWSAYLLADWAANFAVGIISNSQGDKKDCGNKKGDFDADLLAFWAPFLLVHLGGPDTISAFALEDNELWLRHLASLVFQAAAAVYVFLQSLPKNRVWLPTIFIFIDGLIKYAERTLSLYRASFNCFKESMLKVPDPGPNYAQLMDEYRSMKDANLPTRIEMIREPERGTKSVDRVKKGALTDTEVVLYAYRFFDTFKGLIVDLIFSFRERNQSRDFFLERDDEDAFKVIEVELNFIYESLFSKVSVVYTSIGYLFRLISFSLVVTSLGLFYCVDKTNFKSSHDVALSYTLLIGAIALDVIAFIKLITSDWLKVTIKKLPDVDVKDPIIKLPDVDVKDPIIKPDVDVKDPIIKPPDVDVKDPTKKDAKESSYGYYGQRFHPLLRRWSECVLCYNLIFYCLNPRQPLKEKIIDLFKLTNFLDRGKYLKTKPFTKELRKHIFDELHMKSKMADDLYTAKEISGAKGDWTLRVESCPQFLPYILDVDYDQSLLVWHIATELCYNDPDSRDQLTGEEEKHKEFSKLLSDYMLYLLIMQPQMMSKVAGIGQIRFRDTCAEAKNFFAGESEEWKKKEVDGNDKKNQKKEIIGRFLMYVRGSKEIIGRFLKYVYGSTVILIADLIAFFILLPLTFVISLVMNGYNLKEADKKTDRYYSDYKNHFSFLKTTDNDKKNQEKACASILAVNTEVKPVTIKGDRSKSVLFDGCILAKELRNLENKSKWLLMSKVWVEIMSYAAINCRANTHAQQLSKGGELITMVWFLMVHFGLGDQFQINEGQSRAKLIVGK